MAISRRVLLSTTLGIVAAEVLVSEAASQNVPGTAMERADVLVSIKWNDGAPVKGARVFDHIPNRLLGETNEKGEFFFTSTLGTVVRLVEPKYGVQQSLFRVEGTPRRPGSPVPGQNSTVSGFAEGWTL